MAKFFNFFQSTYDKWKDLFGLKGQELSNKLSELLNSHYISEVTNSEYPSKGSAIYTYDSDGLREVVSNWDDSD